MFTRPNNAVADRSRCGAGLILVHLTSEELGRVRRRLEILERSQLSGDVSRSERPS